MLHRCVCVNPQRPFVRCEEGESEGAQAASPPGHLSVVCPLCDKYLPLIFREIVFPRPADAFHWQKRSKASCRAAELMTSADKRSHIYHRGDLSPPLIHHKLEYYASSMATLPHSLSTSPPHPHLHTHNPQASSCSHCNLCPEVSHAEPNQR